MLILWSTCHPTNSYHSCLYLHLNTFDFADSLKLEFLKGEREYLVKGTFTQSTGFWYIFKMQCVDCWQNVTILKWSLFVTIDGSEQVSRVIGIWESMPGPQADSPRDDPRGGCPRCLLPAAVAAPPPPPPWGWLVPRVGVLGAGSAPPLPRPLALSVASVAGRGLHWGRGRHHLHSGGGLFLLHEGKPSDDS